MSDEERRVVGEMHVNPDDPRVIRRPGNAVWIKPTDPDPGAPRIGPLGSEWIDVGYTVDNLTPAPSPLAWPLRQRVTASLDVEVSRETMMLAMGVDPSRDGDSRPVFAVRVKTHAQRRPVAPRKRRGLTGKRYRIARRGYARQMKAYRRGLLPPVPMVYHVPRAALTGVNVPPGAATFRGQAVQFTVLDECVPVDLSTER